MTDFADILKEARQAAGLVMMPIASYERLLQALRELEAEPERKPEVPHECRHCDWLDKHGLLVPQGRPFCEQFRFCPPIEQHRHFGCADWRAREGGA